MTILDELRAQLPDVAMLGDRELDRSRAEALDGVGGDIWVFGYGALMWNPGVPVVETVAARIDGFRRSFCIEVPFGRGTAERPGLTLGLVPGGTCDGLALKIAAGDVDTVTRQLWEREMVWGAYRAQWLPLADTSDTALTFVLDARFRGTTPDLSLQQQAARIATAEGRLGTNLEYLVMTRASLAAAGLRDDYLDELCAAVDELWGLPDLTRL